MRSKVTTLLFLAILFGLPLAQIGLELARGERPLCLDVGRAFVERRLPQFEEDLRKASFVRHELVPRYQHAVSALFGRGNEKAIEGRDGRLFYADDVDLVTGLGVLDPSRAGRRAVEVIGEFRDALAERGVALLVLPVPVKGMVDAQWLSFGGGEPWPDNPDTQAFYDALADAGVDCVDLRGPWRTWAERFPDGLFLERDTHWRPELMQLTAELVAEHVAPLLDAPAALPDAGPEPRAVDVTSEGDLVTMLRLPEGAEVWPPMEFEVRPARDALAAPTTSADVLLLGDSYTKIFSDPKLESGERAGFAERLAVELERPLDVIALVGGSATAVRETLARRAGGLDDKRVVIWEFGLRALAQPPDTWRSVPLPAPGPADPSGAAATEPPVDPPAGGGEGGTDAGACTLRAELLEASRPRDDFDYAFCLVIHRYRVLEVLAGDCTADEVWVAFVGMRDFVVQEPSDFAVGSVHRLVLDPLEEHWDLEEDTWWDVTNDGLGADPEVPFHYAVEWSEER